jgi:hypothetical protein
MPPANSFDSTVLPASRERAHRRRLDTELGRHQRRDPGRPVDPDVALLAGEPEHQRGRPRPVDRSPFIFCSFSRRSCAFTTSFAVFAWRKVVPAPTCYEP